MTIPEDLRTAAEAVIADAMAKLDIKALESAGNHKKLIHDTYVEAIACAILADRALHRADPSPQTHVIGDLADRLRYAADGMDMAIAGEEYGDTTYLDVWRDKPHRVVFEATKLLREAADALATEQR